MRYYFWPSHHIDNEAGSADSKKLMNLKLDLMGSHLPNVIWIWNNLKPRPSGLPYHCCWQVQIFYQGCRWTLSSDSVQQGDGCLCDQLNENLEGELRDLSAVQAKVLLHHRNCANQMLIKIIMFRVNQEIVIFPLKRVLYPRSHVAIALRLLPWWFVRVLTNLFNPEKILLRLFKLLVWTFFTASRTWTCFKRYYLILCAPPRWVF